MNFWKVITININYEGKSSRAHIVQSSIPDRKEPEPDFRRVISVIVREEINKTIKARRFRLLSPANFPIPPPPLSNRENGIVLLLLFTSLSFSCPLLFSSPQMEWRADPQVCVYEPASLLFLMHENLCTFQEKEEEEEEKERRRGGRKRKKRRKKEKKEEEQEEERERRGEGRRRKKRRRKKEKEGYTAPNLDLSPLFLSFSLLSSFFLGCFLFTPFPPLFTRTLSNPVEAKPLFFFPFLRADRPNRTIDQPPSEEGADQWDRRKCHSRKTPPIPPVLAGLKRGNEGKMARDNRFLEWICLFQMLSQPPASNLDAWCLPILIRSGGMLWIWKGVIGGGGRGENFGRDRKRCF